MTTPPQVRAAFWQGWKGCTRPKPEQVRDEFADFVAMLARDGHISEDLAKLVTLC